MEVLGKGAKALGSAAGKAVKAVSGPWTESAVQKPLQRGVRDALAAVAEGAEVEVPATAAIRDNTAAVADAVEGKATGFYAEIDKATVGRFTNTQNKLKNVQRDLRNIIGTDDAKEETLIAKQNEP